MSKKKLYEYRNFKYGLITAMTNEDMPDGSVKTAKNVDFINGQIKTRRPFLFWDEVVPPGCQDVTMLATFYSKTTNHYSYIVEGAGNLYDVDVSLQTYVTFHEAAAVTDYVTFWSPWRLEDIFIFASGDTLYKYNGADWAEALSASAPKGKYLAIHKERLFVAGDPDHPGYVYMSNVGDAETFDVNNAVNAIDWKGDTIQNIIEFADRLYIFLQTSIQVITGAIIDEFAIYSVVSSIGLLAPKALCTNGTDLLFIGNNKKVYSFDGTNLTDLTTSRVSSYFDSIDSAKLGEIRMVDSGDLIYFLIPQVSSTSVMLVFSILTKTWSLYDLPADASSRVKNISMMRGTGVPDALYAATDHSIYYLSSARTAMEQIPATDAYVPVEVEFRPFGAGDQAYKHGFKKLFINCTSTQPVNVYYKTELDDDWTLYTFTPSGSEEVIEHLGKKGRQLFVKITGSKDLDIDSVRTYLKLRKPGK